MTPNQLDQVQHAEQHEATLETLTETLAKISPALHRVRRLNSWIWVILAAACVLNTVHCLVLGAQIRELQRTVARLTVNR
jgi:hypothetical protein